MAIETDTEARQSSSTMNRRALPSEARAGPSGVWACEDTLVAEGNSRFHARRQRRIRLADSFASCASISTESSKSPASDGAEISPEVRSKIPLVGITTQRSQIQLLSAKQESLYKVCCAPGLMEALNSPKDERHGCTEVCEQIRTCASRMLASSMTGLSFVDDFGWIFRSGHSPVTCGP